MDLLTSLRSGRESLLTHGTALATTADNISNANTVGFKGSRPEFADLLAGGNGSLYGGPIRAGSGVTIDQLSLNTAAGSIESTGRPLDVAVSGNGFFVLQVGEAATDTVFTRAGNFRVGNDGTLLSADGFPVLGFGAGGADLTTLNVANVAQAARPTTTASISGNLNTGAPIIGAIPADGSTFQEMNNAAEFRNSVRVFDSLGQPHDVTLFFYHTGNLNYAVRAAVDASEVGGEVGSPAIIGSSEIQFDSTGAQVAESQLAIAAAWTNGANPSAFNLNTSAVSGFSTQSYFSSFSQDGFRAGQVVGTEISSDGTVNAVLDNEERVALGVLALGRFPNTGGLERIGDNNFRASSTSGDVEFGRPGEDGRGSIVGSSLEGSNTDLATEFVEVIRFQRAYQAGSQVIQTSNSLLEATIQIA